MSETFTIAQIADLGSLYGTDRSSYAQAWYNQLADYRKAWYYYSGEVFREVSERSEDDTPASLLFPVKINLVKQAINMHALYMWGQYNRDRIVDFTVLPKRKTVKSATSRAEELHEFFTGLLRDNAAASLFREHGRLYQIFGGCFFKIYLDPQKPNRIGIIGVSPEYVEPVWNPTDYRDLLRIHVHYQIDAAVARHLYGYVGETTQMVDYVETWTKEAFVIRVGDQIARDPETGQPMAGPVNLEDPSTSKRYLPWIYVPRLRTGSFYGELLATDLMGLQDELNARVADTGDAVTAAAHQQIWGHDLARRKTKGEMHLTAGTIFDAGDTPPGGETPEIEVLPAPEVKDTGLTFITTLRDYGRDVAQLSPVMFGQDEGSQRSALTLSMRALPTTSIIDDYRTDWGIGIADICYLALITLYQMRETTDSGLKVNKDHFGHRVEVEFAAILPKDREALVKEVIDRFAAGLISRKRALELLPDVPDVEAELAAIEAEEKAKMEQEAEKAQQEADTQAANAERQTKLQTEGQIAVAKAKGGPKKESA